MEASSTHPFAFSIRQQTVNDRDEIYHLIQMAFETAKVKDGDEQDFAARLQDSDAFIPELGLVACSGNQLIGHILFTRTHIIKADNSRTEVLLVAPLSVLLEYRDQGVGSALMEKGLRTAQAMGFKAAFLCGDPDYYIRFGYSLMSDFGITSSGGIPQQYCMAYELIPGSLTNAQGVLAGF